jgi:hypothetical protein
MNVPTFFVQFGTYEALKRVLKARDEAIGWREGLVSVFFGVFEVFSL